MTAERKIRVGFALLTIAPLILGIVAWQNATQLVSAASDVADTNDLVRRLESFLSRLKDVEVAHREYILTGDELYLSDIEQARNDIDVQLAAISDTRAAQRDPQWIALLRSLVPQKFDEVRKTIEARRDGDLSASSVLNARGSLAMDDMRVVLRRWISNETEELKVRSSTQNTKFANTMAIFGAVLLMTVLLIWSLFYLIRREARQVRRLNEELEQRVEQRTVELRRSNDELQQFAYVASHDLKEPMRMISSYSSLLERRCRDQLAPEAREWIGFMVDGVRRMNILIDDLLDYSRIGRVAADQKQYVNTRELLETVRQNLSVAIAENQACLIISDPLPAVLYEPVRLTQVLQNLIGNAIKYRASDRAPEIHVSAVERVTEMVFSVRDNGLGIAREHQEEVFGIFKRLHGREVEGTGIGLATCRKIVEEHGGRIWVESEPGRGSTFLFTVPHPRHAAGDRRISPPPAASKARSV